MKVIILTLLTMAVVVTAAPSQAHPPEHIRVFQNSMERGTMPPSTIQGNSYGHFGSYQTLALRNVPLLQAIHSVDRIGPRKIVLSPRAAKLCLEPGRTVTLYTRANAQLDLLEQLLAGLDLVTTMHKDQLELHVIGEKVRKRNLTTIESLMMEQLLQSPLRLHMDFVPATMAISMIEGFTGLRIQHAVAGETFPFGGPMVTIHSEHETVASILEAIAEQLGNEVVINGSQIELREIPEDHLQDAPPH